MTATAAPPARRGTFRQQEKNMRINRLPSLVPLGAALVVLALLAACTPALTPTLPPAPTAASPAATTAAPPAATTVAPPAATTAAPPPATTAAPPPAATSTAPASPQPAYTYLDDRSSAWSLMQSFADALDRHQYLRAYSYWEPDAAQLQPYAQFEAGYAGTQSVQITIGTVTEDAGAGQFYSIVPVVLVATTTGGATQTFAGCYTLHISNPGIQGVPPFKPLGIRSATVQAAANGANPADLLAHACEGTSVPSEPQSTPPTPAGLGADNYVDNRSTGTDVIRSLVNAINRHEYVRAYSYWEPDAVGLAPYAQFEAGYADTQSVLLTTGAETPGAAAGNLYAQVPVTLVSTSDTGTVTTYVGCYLLHLGSPDAQGVPPFKPMAIQRADVRQVANDADTGALMAQACQQP
jgi:hypothetical protein